MGLGEEEEGQEERKRERKKNEEGRGEVGNSCPTSTADNGEHKDSNYKYSFL